MDYYDKPDDFGPRRSRSKNGLGCSCDCNYSRSRQGICKIAQLCIIGLAWIIIAASPYYRPIFVIGGETWPFHIVMLLTVLAWFITLTCLIMFLIGYHHQYPNMAWPTIELRLNIVLFIMILTAAILEAANVWRWDMYSNQFQSNPSQFTGGSTNLYQYGLRPGMSFTQTLNFNQYCITRPNECRDYFNLLMGNNSYFTNHIFAVILLFIGLITYAVSTYFAYKTWRAFKRDMARPGDERKPTMWMKWQYRFQTTRDNAKNKVTGVFKRDGDNDDNLTSDEEGGHEIDITVEDKKQQNGSIVGSYLSPGPKSDADPPSYYAPSYKSHKSHKSHKSSSSKHGSHHSSRHHRHHRSSSHSDEKSDRRSHASNHSSSRTRSRDRHRDRDDRSSSGRRSRHDDKKISNHEDEVFEENEKDASQKSSSRASSTPLSPTASVIV